MKQLIAICVLGLSSCVAFAQYAKVDGQFRSKNTSLDLIALDSESGVIAASTTVTQGSCSGSVAGVGKVVKNVLQFSPYTKGDRSDTCVIKVTFEKGWNAAKIEADGCMRHSGASCGWEGDVVRRAK